MKLKLRGTLIVGLALGAILAVGLVAAGQGADGDTLDKQITQQTFEDHRETAVDADEVAAPVTGIRPGSPIEISFPGAGSTRCTASWVTTDGTSYYIGTAGHCVLNGGALSSQDEDYEGASVIACVASCESETRDLDGATFVELGDVFYAQSAYLRNPAVSQGYDFAFVEIPVQHYDLVNTSIARWDGPTEAVERAEPEAGDLALQYGHGVGLGEAYPTEGRVGVFDGDGTTVTEECHHEGDGCVVHFTGTVTPGDSGSPVAVGTIDPATGEIQAQAAAGITTDAAGYMTWGFVPFTPLGFPERAHTALGTHIQQAIDLTTRATGTQLSLVPSDASLPLPAPSPPDGVGAENPGTGDSLVLDWEAAVSTLPIAEYEVYRSTGTGSFDDRTLVHETGNKSFEDTGLAAGETYCYQIVAVDEDGQRSAPTPEACATVEAEGPPAPAVRASNPGLGGQLTVAWSEPDHVRAIDHYVVERSVDGSDFETISTQQTRVLADEGLHAASSYAYRVHAVDAAGLAGEADTTRALQPTVDAPEWRQHGHDVEAQAFTGAAGNVVDPTVETTELAGPSTSQPTVADLDGSGQPYVVAVTDATERGERVTVQALESSGSSLEGRWSVDLPATLIVGLEPNVGTASTAIAELDDDPAEEVVAYVNYRVDAAGEAATQDGAVYVIDGASGAIEYEQNGVIGFGTDTAPRVGDVLGGPAPEIVVLEEGPEVTVLGLADGALVVEAVGSAGSGTTTATPVLADVAPARPGLEIALAATADETGQLYLCEPADDDANCQLHATTPSGATGLAAGTLSPVVTPSLVVHSDQAPGLAIRPTASAGTNVTVDVGPLANAPAIGPIGANGRNAIASGLADPSPTDLANDGDLLLHGSTSSGFAALDRLERTGSVDEPADVAGQAIADVDGDGNLEIVAVDESGTLLAWRPAAEGGSTVWTVDLGASVEAGPVLADVDGDGAIEVLVATQAGDLEVVGPG